MRYSLAATISAVVERIDVYPLSIMLEEFDIEIEPRKFIVTFRNGSSRYVVPDDDVNMALGVKKH